MEIQYKVVYRWGTVVSISKSNIFFRIFYMINITTENTFISPHRLINRVFTYGFGVLLNWLFTEACKLYVGSLRPYFLDVCQPNCNKYTNQSYIMGDVCKGDADLIKEARYTSNIEYVCWTIQIWDIHLYSITLKFCCSISRTWFSAKSLIGFDCLEEACSLFARTCLICVAYRFKIASIAFRLSFPSGHASGAMYAMVFLAVSIPIIHVHCLEQRTESKQLTAWHF